MIDYVLQSSPLLFGLEYYSILLYAESDIKMLLNNDSILN